MYQKTQQGLTLVEMMVALVIGLLITAAAGFLFVTSQSGLNLQRANVDLQDNANFGLNFILSDLKKANYGAATPVVDVDTLYGGVVLTQNNVTAKLDMAPSLMTLGNGDAGWNGLSNVVENIKSDQLTIMFKPTQNQYTDEAFEKLDLATMTTAEKQKVVSSDCEGNNITVEDVLKNTFIIQRYFLREDSVNNNEPNRALALACDARRFNVVDLDAASSKLALTDIGNNSNGEIVMRRVDHFHILLGVAEGKSVTDFKNMRYMTVSDYKTITTNKPRIISLQVGFITRSYDSAGQNELVNSAPVLQLMNQTVTLKTVNSSANKKFVRDSLVQTVALRNGLGVDNR